MGASRQPAVSGTAFAVRDAWPWPTLARLAALGDDPVSDADARRALAAAALAAAELPSEAVQPLLERVCLSGDAPRARARLEEYRRAGCDLPVAYPVPFGADGQASVAGTLRALAPSG